MIFRAYDIRGVIDKDLDADISQKIGRAFASEMEGQENVFVGRDNRPSSRELAEAFMAGVHEAGLNSVDIGEVATPIVYHASVTNNSAPAVMITGSHLPPDRNGFKLTQGTTPFYGDDIQKLRVRIEKNDYASGKGIAYRDDLAASRYEADIAGRLPGDPDKQLRIVVDAGNGMAGMFAPTLVRYMRHRSIELYCRSNGTYPNHPADPFEEENLLDLKATVMTQNADLGIAFDGDADRMGLVDSDGYAHATDRAVIPLVWDILKRNPGATIVTDSLVSSVLTQTIKASGGVPLMWKSGHSHIKQKMKEVKAPLALETSGHVFIADNYYGYDDGIFTAMRMVEILSREGTATLAHIMEQVPRLHTTPQFRPACPEDKKDEVVEAIAKAFKKFDLNRVDGVRVEKPEGWFIVRPSNTEPKLSLRFEAESESALGALVDEVGKVLERFDIEI